MVSAKNRSSGLRSAGHGIRFRNDSRYYCTEASDTPGAAYRSTDRTGITRSRIILSGDDRGSAAGEAKVDSWGSGLLSAVLRSSVRDWSGTNQGLHRRFTPGVIGATHRATGQSVRVPGNSNRRGVDFRIRLTSARTIPANSLPFGNDPSGIVDGHPDTHTSRDAVHSLQGNNTRNRSYPRSRSGSVGRPTKDPTERLR